MKQITCILITIQLVNWYIDWPLGWKILFTVFGASLWVFTWILKTAQPDPNQPTPYEPDDEYLC